MSQIVPDSVQIESTEGIKSIPVESWLKLPNSSKIQLITRHQVLFLNRGKKLPIKAALTAISGQAA